MKGNTIMVRWRAAALGTGVGVVFMACACAGAAGLMAKGTVGMDTMDLWAAGITAGTGLCAGLAAMLRGGNAVEAAVSELGVLVVLFGLNGGLCGGKMEGIPFELLALAGGCGGALLLRMGQGSGRKRRRRKGKNR